MVTTSIQERHKAAIERMKAGRNTLLEVIQGVSADDALRGTEWSVADAVRHLGEFRPGGSRFPEAIKRLLDDNHVEPPPRLAREEQWQRLIQQTVEAIDELMAFFSSLSEEQSARTGQRFDRTVSVMDLVEIYTGHVEDHAKQIRDEIRPRLGI